MNQSPQFAINWNDVLKGLIMAIGTPVLFVIEQTVNSGTVTFNWKEIGMAALAGGITYLTKNFLSKPAAVSDSAVAK